LGTSHAAPAPKTVKWGAVAGSLKNPNRQGSTVLSATFMAALPLIPGGFASVPALYCAYECFKFASDVQKNGLEATVKKEEIQLSTKFLVPSISNCLWNLAATKMGPELTNTPFGKLAEVAFKKTVSAVLTNGIKAFEEQATGDAPEKNLKQFMEKFGQDGFLQVYFSKYLYEIADYYLHSTSPNVESDTGYWYYFAVKEKLFSPQQLDDFRTNLRSQCTIRSKPLVDRLKQIGLLQKLLKDPSLNPETTHELANELEQVLLELVEEGSQ